MKNKYFSGQGVVSLESDGKIYDLGNCTDLIFYDDNTFDLVWESLSKDNIKLLLGKHVGTQQITDGDKETVYNKYEIRPNIQRNYTLHFDGINTAHLLGEPIKISVSVSINIPAVFLSFINDELASFHTTGKWKSPITLLLPNETYKHTENNKHATVPGLALPVRLAKNKIVRSGDFIKILKLKDSGNYEVVCCINVNNIQKISPEKRTLTAIATLDGCTEVVECDIQTVINMVTNPPAGSLPDVRHVEYTSGKRFVDMTYTRGSANNIETSYKRK